MSCSDCHYFRGIKGTPFGRCYNHPDVGRILYDDDKPACEKDVSGVFLTPRWGNFMCETPRLDSKPPPWEYVPREERRSSVGPSKRRSH